MDHTPLPPTPPLAHPTAAAAPTCPGATEHYDPTEAFDINRFAPASHTDLAIANAIRTLIVPPAPAAAWDVLLTDFALRAPHHRAAAEHLARHVRQTPPPPPTADQWTNRSATLTQNLTARAERFAATAAFLAAQTRALPVPPPPAEQWAARARHITTAVTARKQSSERLEKITRDEPVRPRQPDPEQLQSDWHALEATLRQGPVDDPPAVPPQRWDSMWNRIQHNIEPKSAAAPAAPTTPAAPASTPVARTAPPAAPRLLKPRWPVFYTVIVAAAALVLVAFGLWKFLPAAPGTGSPHGPHNPDQPLTRGNDAAPRSHDTAQMASLDSAEILDMGEVDDSVTSVVRTTTGSHPVTVVVIVNQ